MNSTQPESKDGGGVQGESGVNASRPKKNGGGWKKQGRDGWKEPYQREGMDGHAGGFKRQPRGGFRGRFREGPNRLVKPLFRFAIFGFIPPPSLNSEIRLLGEPLGFGVSVAILIH